MIFSELYSIKRSPTAVSGVRGAPVLVAQNVLGTPDDPVEQELALRVTTKAPLELRQVFLDGDFDVDEGDTLVNSDDVETPIRWVGRWRWKEEAYLHLLIEAFE